MTEIRRSCSYGEPKIQPSPVPKPKSTCFSVTSTTYSCPLQCQSARYPAKNSRFLAGELVDNPSKIDLDIPVHYWQTKTSLIALSRSPSRLLFLRGQEVLQTASFCFLLWGPAAPTWITLADNVANPVLNSNAYEVYLKPSSRENRYMIYGSLFGLPLIYK